MSEPGGFALNPRLDVARLRKTFAERRRVQIADFLEVEGAERLLRHLEGRPDWKLVLNSGDKVFEIDRPTWGSLEPERKAKLDVAVAEGARWGFQYRYESLRVPDEEQARIASATLIDDLARFLSSGKVIALLREITGEDMSFADAQATCYGAGHFLTAHDDHAEGKNRRAAYVLGLARQWRPEWGGLLMFHDADGGVSEVFRPRFNCLSLFAVPQPHSVSYVTPAAASPRYSVTGWLRAGAKP